MDENVPSGEFLLHQFVKLRKVLRDIFGFHIEEGVDDVVDGVVVFDVVHADCGCDDCMDDGLPVWICYFFMNSRSRAEEISPKKMDFPD